MVVNVIHKPSKHWATLKSRVKVLKLLWSKKKVDYYTLEFSESCLQALPMPINTPYLGGSDTANVDIEYNIS